MVPTNEPRAWFGWVAQGWNITFLSLVHTALPGQMPRVTVSGRGGIGQARCWVLEPQVWFHRPQPNPDQEPVRLPAGGGVW